MAQKTNEYSRSDEIDLLELLQALWASKALIIVVTFVLTGLAAAYAFLSTPVYQTSVHTLPPTASGLASYNVASQLTGEAIRGTVSSSSAGIEALSTYTAYQTFLRHLKSATIRQAFFDQYYLPVQDENETERQKQRAWRRLDNNLTIKLPQKPDEQEASVTLTGENPKIIAKWANAYVNLALQAASQELVSGLVGEVSIRRLSLEDQIATVRQTAETIRENRIIRLEGAISIAESIGLETLADGASFVAINAQGLNTESVSSGSLLYLRGSRALTAELQQLEQRESNDAYIAELPDLLKKQALLSSVNLNPELLSVATIDRAAIVPEEPAGPRKLLVMILGLILGAGLSILIVLAKLLFKVRT